jgi:hypothetical protein
MEYIGNTLVWTGLMVHKDFVDEPNQSNLIPDTADRPNIPQDPRPDLNNFQRA